MVFKSFFIYNILAWINIALGFFLLQQYFAWDDWTLQCFLDDCDLNIPCLSKIATLIRASHGYLYSIEKSNGFGQLTFHLNLKRSFLFRPSKFVLYVQNPNHLWHTIWGCILKSQSCKICHTFSLLLGSRHTWHWFIACHILTIWPFKSLVCIGKPR